MIIILDPVIHRPFVLFTSLEVAKADPYWGGVEWAEEDGRWSLWDHDGRPLRMAYAYELEPKV